MTTSVRPLLVGLVMLVLASLAAPAWACRCPPSISPVEAYRYADVVVEADVLNVADDQALRETVATLKVSKAWKGSIAAELQVATRTSCAYDFSAGRQALLYLRYDDKRKRYETRRCMGNLPLTEAAKSQAWLTRHGKPGTTTPR